MSLADDSPLDLLIGYLTTITKDFQNPPEKRLTASYLIATSQIHQNSVRLMAQILEILHGDLEVPTPLGNFPDANDPSTEVGWYNDIIHRTAVEFGVAFTAGDFEGHPIELLSSVPKDIEEKLNGEDLLNMHQTIIHFEAIANNEAAAYAELFGYHPIFRAGLCKYYMTLSLHTTCQH
jgi:hypothetical protein